LLRTNGEVETRLSPSVRRALQQHGIDASRIQGTGRDGRITREDVDRYVAEATVVSVGEPATAQPRQFSPQDIPHDRMRLTIAENMVRAVSEAPHVTALFEADFSAVAAHKASMAAKGTKLSYTAYIVKAAAAAMAVAPAINGRWEKDRIAISPTIDIGVGTALGEKGLVVPVVKDAGSLSLEQIGAKLDDLTRRAREGKLERSDVSGGSFTISNHGVSGSLLAAPIILHQGQAAILGVGKLEKRVVVREIGGQDAILVRPMAYVTLTIDHRVVDGHQTNAWLTRFVEILENWQQP
jgi:2-oxoglutarate dehydrogenase E2 component (dihydrolipoamide succinyltransferase)